MNGIFSSLLMAIEVGKTRHTTIVFYVKTLVYQMVAATTNTGDFEVLETFQLDPVKIARAFIYVGLIAYKIP